MVLTRVLRFILGHPLNQNRKLWALCNFVKWQFGSRLVPGPIVYNWIDDAQLIVRRGEAAATGNLYCGLMEFEEMAYVLHVTTPDDLFVDVGANSGAFTVLACAARGARGYCFEPVPTVYARLRDNLYLNRLTDRVCSMNVGISDREGELVFSTDSDARNHVIAENERCKDRIAVRVTTLDAVLANESPTMLKIDTEGYEAPVINGAAEVLRKESLHSVILELTGHGARYGFDENRIRESLVTSGFTPCSYDPVTRSLKPADRDNPAPRNVLFVRQPELVIERLARAPRITIGRAHF